MDEPIAFMCFSEKQEFSGGDGCEIHGCKNQAAWLVPVRGNAIYNEKRLCSPCVDRTLALNEVDKSGRVGLRVAGVPVPE